jgi:hypothetical protein
MLVPQEWLLASMKKHEDPLTSHEATYRIYYETRDTADDGAARVGEEGDGGQSRASKSII